MKKSLTICAVLAAILTVGGLAQGAVYSISDSTDSAGASKGLLGMAEKYDSPVGVATLLSVTDIAGDPGVEYDTDFTGADGFQEISIGYRFSDGMPTGDISAYNSYSLKVKNAEAQKQVMVRLFVNTGWTDPNWDQTDQYVGSTWTWIAPGATTTLTLDLTTLGLTDDSDLGNGDFSGEDRRTRLTGIGLQYGSNVVASGAVGAYEINSGDTLAIQVVPEPATIGVLILAAIPMAFKRKR